MFLAEIGVFFKSAISSLWCTDESSIPHESLPDVKAHISVSSTQRPNEW